MGRGQPVFPCVGWKGMCKCIIQDWQSCVAVTSNSKIPVIHIFKKAYFVLLYSVVYCGAVGKGHSSQ